MKYDGIVIFSDMDGTLLDPERKLSPENVKAVQHFIKEGGRFGVATGRMHRTTLVKFPELPINVPSIFYNGALVYDLQNRTKLFSVLIPEGLLPVLQDIYALYPDVGLELVDPEKAYILRNHAVIKPQLDREGLEGVSASWDEVPHQWYKIIFAGDHEALRKVKAHVDSLNRPEITIIFSEKEFLDVMASNVSKGRALAQQMKEHEKDWKMVFALGDNDNDYEMIQTAHVGIAVGNARTKIKEIAKHVIQPHSVPCIPQVLEIIDSYL